ncbi:MAG: efflux RND transporter permease subunit [Prosthecobacter sp.]|uniref:efflux RND transporter permease subunit n=1 Tax=Prosthecobacter sp. TaxID=1965333 RepID=UPI003BAE83CE
MINEFIRRPVLSMVISIIITFLGLLALYQLPITQFPSIAPPEVNVTVEYIGANAETLTKAAIVPLERSINGVPGMKYMSSRAANDGVGVISIVFEAGTDPDVAAVNVQNRVNKMMGELPEEVIKAGVQIAKEEKAMLMYLDVTSTNPELDEMFLYNFADINILTELKRIEGVGFAKIIGVKEYSMRIWLKPDKMLTYNISTEDVLLALKEQNVEAAPGKVGESSDKTEPHLQYVVRYAGKYQNQEDYEKIPIRSNDEGQVLRIKDVAEVEFSTLYFDVETRFNGRPTAAILLKQLPGSNANEVIASIKQRMAEIKEDTFLQGMDYDISYDVSRFLDASLHEVVRTLAEAFLLVSLVTFVFLQDWRSTLIPVIAVPVSLVGTFFFMQLLGFSLNLITLLALVLAIGIVVDGAIVVVEAVHAKMESTGAGPRQATEEAMGEIGGAIIAITLVMAAVFVPASFMSGPSGIFYQQFSLTMAIAIVLSGCVALTLTPALCALMLKNMHHAPRSSSLLNRFFGHFNRSYDKISATYTRWISALAGRRTLSWGILLGFCVVMVFMGGRLPSGFIPNEDQGAFYVGVTTPAGSTLERTKAVVDEIQNCCKGITSISSVSTLAGVNIITDASGATYGSCLINLTGWHERTESVRAVMDELLRRTHHIKDAEIELFSPPAVPGYGNASGFELRLLDRTGSGDFKNMESVAAKFIDDLEARPEIANSFTSFDASFPQYLLHVDSDIAAQKGVTTNNVMSTLQTMLGGKYATNFIRFGQLYKVMVQVLPEYRARPEDILKLHVKNDLGEMVQISTFVELEKVYGVDQVTRHNMFTSAEINGEPAAGFSSGAAIQAIQETAREKLPKGFGIDWAGITRDQILAGNQAVFIFLICLAFVYLLLSAQYESFLLPMPVILSLPTGLLGAFVFLLWMGLENNIYAQVSMIMLIGLLGKNAILVVEFAIQRQREGLTPLQAAVESATSRLRPILMTSLAFVAGLSPLMMASGVGAAGNRTIGASAVGGMIFGTVFGMLIIPGLYVIFASFTSSPKPSKEPEHA